MSDIVNLFIKNGFLKTSNDSEIEKTLFNDFKVSITCEEGGEGAFLDLYIYSSVFSLCMDELFSNGSLATQIQPRKMRDDRSGCLCMVSTELEKVDGKHVLWLGGEPIDVSEFLLLLSNVTTVQEFYEEMYLVKNGYFIWVEGIWVYLYLLSRIGCSVDEMIHRLKSAKMQTISKQWRLKAEVSDEDMALLVERIASKL